MKEINKDNWEENYPIPKESLKEEWRIEQLEKSYCDRDGNLYYSEIADWWLEKLAQREKEVLERIVPEELDLNIKAKKIGLESDSQEWFDRGFNACRQAIIDNIKNIER